MSTIIVNINLNDDFLLHASSQLCYHDKIKEYKIMNNIPNIHLIAQLLYNYKKNIL